MTVFFPASASLARQLLELSALCLRCEVGDLLTDESCWSIFLACYNLYHITTNDKSFGLLRDTAGNTLAHIVLMLFSCPRVSRASVTAAPPPPPGGATPDADAEAARERGVILHETVGQWTEAVAGAAAAGAGAAERADKPSSDPSRTPPKLGGGDGDRGERPIAGRDSRTSGVSHGSPGLWRQGSPLTKEKTGEGVTGGEKTRAGSYGYGGEPLEGAAHEEEPWPSVDGAGDDGTNRGVDDSVVGPITAAAPEFPRRRECASVSYSGSTWYALQQPP